jgi:2-phospho-L-lactate guanylyltransferase
VGGAWIVVVPVKRLESAKTRLRGAVPGVAHDRLVLAVVQDTVAAALACRDVADLLVVTSDPAVARAVGDLGARAVPDEPDAGLNPALAHGGRLAGGGPVVALAGDLPALRPAELSAALSATGGRRGFVPDAAGTGTTLLASPTGTGLDPRFGPGSARAHAGSGARTLTGPWPSLRRDVDTGPDLAAAATIGLGTRTDALYRAGRGYGAHMQGTVASYDPEERSGTVLLDDGAEFSFSAGAFDASGLRLLRPGQRVSLEHDGDEITGLSLITMAV